MPCLRRRRLLPVHVQVGATDCHFAYRMLMVLMRRELPLEQVRGAPGSTSLTPPGTRGCDQAGRPEKRAASSPLLGVPSRLAHLNLDGLVCGVRRL